VSLLAGATGLGIGAFLLWDVAGEGLFVLGNLAVGRVLSADGLSDKGLLIALGTLAVLSYVGVWAATQYVTRHQHASIQTSGDDNAPAQPHTHGGKPERRTSCVRPLARTVVRHAAAHQRHASRRIVWGEGTLAWEPASHLRTQRASTWEGHGAHRRDVTI
jgi:hypothetical protein